MPVKTGEEQADMGIKTKTSFVPGVSGNPNGRPKKGDALNDVLKDRADKDALADKILELAMGGSEPMLKYAYDRIYGKPIETMHNIIQNLPDIVEIDLSENQADSSTDTTLEE